MIRSWVLISVLIMLNGMAFASVTDLWQKGNAFYQNKQYDSAVYCFEQIIQSNPGDPTVYYNNGNSYFRLNNIGMAVLNYRRALRINPDFKEASDNLLLAEARISNHIHRGPDLFFVQWWNAATHPSLTNTHGIIALVLFLLFLGAILLRKYKSQQWIRPQLIIGLACVWSLFLFLSFIAAGKARLSDHAVVLQNDAPMVNAPQQTQAQSYIPEGTTIKILNEQSGFAEVRLPDGRTGWMKREYIEEI